MQVVCFPSVMGTGTDAGCLFPISVWGPTDAVVCPPSVYGDQTLMQVVCFSISVWGPGLMQVVCFSLSVWGPGLMQKQTTCLFPISVWGPTDAGCLFLPQCMGTWTDAGCLFLPQCMGTN